jgi:hypothetical protein
MVYTTTTTISGVLAAIEIDADRLLRALPRSMCLFFSWIKRLLAQPR